MLLEGLHIPLTTPFHPDGRLNPRKLAANVVRYSKTPTAGLIVLGPSGESTLLSDDETREVLRTAAEAASPEKVLIAGISRDSVQATLALAEFAAEQNYDVVLVGVPSFLALEHQSLPPAPDMDLPRLVKTRFSAQRTFFKTVADRSPLPILLLHVHGRIIRFPDVVELASHPNIIGIFGSGWSSEMQQSRISGLLNRTAGIRREVAVTATFAAVTRRMSVGVVASKALVSVASLTGTATAIVELQPAPPQIRTRTKVVGFQTIATRTRSMLEALNAGAAGIAPAFAAAAPQASYEVFAAWKDSDQLLAEEKQIRLIAAAKLAEDCPAALKYACDLNGYFGGLPRLPHLPLTGEQRSALEACMKDIRN
ncbi:MAG: dihydrodipicolinate synthase family protein [Acidobacteriota bacterium]|nr:dihydrodipicolinate synthase family protein [Acidobacteriota bacterium]